MPSVLQAAATRYALVWEQRYLHLLSAGGRSSIVSCWPLVKVYMELGSYFLFLKEQIKDIIDVIIILADGVVAEAPATLFFADLN